MLELITPLLVTLQAYMPQIVIFTVLGTLIYKAHKSDHHKFNVFDYFVDQTTGGASITRTGQSIAILTSTWIVAKMAAAGTLTTEMFAIYLAALGVSEGWSKFVGAKWGSPNKVEDKPE